MRMIPLQREHGRLRFGLIYGSIVLIVLAAARSLPLGSLFPPCPFRGLTGLSCPTCGTTRALLLLAQGELAAALSMNPLAVLVVLSSLVWMAMDAVLLALRVKVPGFAMTATEGTALRIAAVLLFLGNWIFLVLRHP